MQKLGSLLVQTNSDLFSSRLMGIISYLAVSDLEPIAWQHGLY